MFLYGTTKAKDTDVHFQQIEVNNNNTKNDTVLRRRATSSNGVVVRGGDMILMRTMRFVIGDKEKNV
jgi:hypothetical protein